MPLHQHEAEHENAFGMCSRIPWIMTFIYCNVAIFIFVRNHNKKVRDLRVSPAFIQKRNRKLSLMVSIVVGTHLLSWVAGTVSITVMGSLFFGRFLRLLHHLGKASNFFVYGLLDKEFRKQLKKLFPRTLTINLVAMKKSATQRKFIF